MKKDSTKVAFSVYFLPHNTGLFLCDKFKVEIFIIVSGLASPYRDIYLSPMASNDQ